MICFKRLQRFGPPNCLNNFYLVCDPSLTDLLDDLDLLRGTHVSKWSLDLHSSTLREQLIASDYHHPSVSEVNEEQSCQGPFSKEYLDELKFLLFMLLLALWGVALIVVFVNL